MNIGFERAPTQGLPSVDQMRADIENEEIKKFRESFMQKLSEYQDLFNRFKAGKALTQEETSRMANLSDELARLSQGLER